MVYSTGALIVNNRDVQCVKEDQLNDVQQDTPKFFLDIPLNIEITMFIYINPYPDFMHLSPKLIVLTQNQRRQNQPEITYCGK